MVYFGYFGVCRLQQARILQLFVEIPIFDRILYLGVLPKCPRTLHDPRKCGEHGSNLS